MAKRWSSLRSSRHCSSWLSSASSCSDSDSSWQRPTPGKEIFVEMLTAAVIRRRDIKDIASLLSMVDRPDTKSADWKQKAVISALTVQARGDSRPLVLQEEPALFRSRKLFPESEILLNLFEWPGHQVDTAQRRKANPLNDKEQQQFASGRLHYLTTCAGCHGTDGKGLKRFAPPLVGSEWVLGDEKRLALIVLHGMEGPVQVNGKRYDAPDILPVMPSHSPMDDAALAQILTYIRNEWGNGAPPVTRRTVGMTRVLSQGRVVPWTAAELDKHVTASASE